MMEEVGLYISFIGTLFCIYLIIRLNGMIRRVEDDLKEINKETKEKLENILNKGN